MNAYNIRVPGPCRVAGRHLSQAPNEPIPSRPYADGKKGANHATSHEHCTHLYLNPGRRPQEEGLTQQATNSTCVTARRDGQCVDAPESWPQPQRREWPFKSVREFDDRINREVVVPIMRGEA